MQIHRGFVRHHCDTSWDSFHSQRVHSYRDSAAGIDSVEMAADRASVELRGRNDDIALDGILLEDIGYVGIPDFAVNSQMGIDSSTAGS